MEEEESWLLHLNFLRCSQAALMDGWKFAQALILANLAYRFLMQNNSFPNPVRHTISMVLGTLLLYGNIGLAYLWPIGLMLGAYSVMLLVCKIGRKKCGGVVVVAVIIFLLCCELFVVNPKMWQQIRGIQMVVAMKVISIAMDVDSGLLNDLPDVISYTGYVICPANCVMGPWTPFWRYEESLKKTSLKTAWIATILKYLTISFIALILSTCFLPLYVSDDSNRWFLAFRDAQSFRMSHYFVSAISQASMVAAGFGFKDGDWDVPVTNPLQIELPRSLVQVVVYWNIPMHKWLKTYVFKACRNQGRFFAIFATYTISSLLHGLNFQLSAVLLSIGTFSFVEYNIRQKLSKIFNCCVQASPCGKSCGHRHKSNNIIVSIVNFFFSLVTMLHLAYLGVMFEASFSVQESGYSYLHTLGKWHELDFASHIITFITYFAYMLMSFFEY